MKRKCLAVGIILLFVGTSLIPLCSGNVKNQDLQQEDDPLTNTYVANDIEISMVLIKRTVTTSMHYLIVNHCPGGIVGLIFLGDMNRSLRSMILMISVRLPGG